MRAGKVGQHAETHDQCGHCLPIGGDTLIVGNGTYDEFISDNGYPSGYSGTIPPSGRSGAYTTIKAQNVHGATIRPNRGGPDHQRPVILSQTGLHHIRIEGFVLDANYGATGLRSCTGTGGSTSNIQFVDIDCKNGWQGFVGNGTNIEYIRVWSHGHGFGPNGENTCKGADGVNLTAERCHGFYLQAGASGQFTITESRLWGNNGYGFQSYQTGVTLQHSVFEGNTSGGAIIIGPGGNISNNCFARQETPIQCAGCTQEGNILNAGVCAGPPPPQNVPAPQNLRATVR